MSLEASPLLQSQLAGAQPGDVLDITEANPVLIPSLRVIRRWTGGTLVFSDNPESLNSPGVLYAGTVPADFVRLMLYHVNTGSTDLHLSVVLEPVDAANPPTITLRRRIRHGPSRDYFRVGRLAALDFVSLPDDPQSQSIGEPTLLDPALDQLSGFRSTALIAAQYDFDVVGGDLRFTILARAPETDSLDVYRTLPFLPPEGSSNGAVEQGRGTFPGCANRAVSNAACPYCTVSGMVHIRMANGISDPDVHRDVDRDAYAGEDNTGFDAVSGVPSQLVGNYGVMYRVHLRWENPDGRQVAVLLNPLGGAFAGAVAEILDTGESRGFTTPSLSSGPVSDSSKAMLLGTWDPSQSPDVALRWTPPGASNLPVDWLLVPFTAPG